MIVLHLLSVSTMSAFCSPALSPPKYRLNSLSIRSSWRYNPPSESRSMEKSSLIDHPTGQHHSPCSKNWPMGHKLRNIISQIGIITYSKRVPQTHWSIFTPPKNNVVILLSWSQVCIGVPGPHIPDNLSMEERNSKWSQSFDASRPTYFYWNKSQFLPLLPFAVHQINHPICGTVMLLRI